jgi:hypothetical protein
VIWTKFTRFRVWGWGLEVRGWGLEVRGWGYNPIINLLLITVDNYNTILLITQGTAVILHLYTYYIEVSGKTMATTFQRWYCI